MNLIWAPWIQWKINGYQNKDNEEKSNFPYSVNAGTH